MTISLSASLWTESSESVCSEYPRSLICQISSPLGKRKTLKPRPFIVLRMSFSSWIISALVSSSSKLSWASVFWSNLARLSSAESQIQIAAAAVTVAMMKLNFRCLISAKSMMKNG